MHAEPSRAYRRDVTTPGPADPAAPAGPAGLLADRTRAAFCLALIDGRDRRSVVVTGAGIPELRDRLGVELPAA